MSEWEKMAGESVEDWERFQDYCVLGSERTLEELWRQQCLLTGVRRAVPVKWVEVARRFEWERRCRAWDAAGGEQAQEVEKLRSSARRRSRRRLIERALLLGITLLDRAALESLDANDARTLAPTARQLVKDMLVAARAESKADEGTDAQSLHYTADDFAAAEREARTRLGLPMPTGVPTLTPEMANRLLTPKVQGNGSAPRLLICLGDDPALEVDLAMLRGVRARTGLAFHALHRVTRETLARSLRRARAAARPVRYLHLACHAHAAGIEFADGTVDGAWLSARLEGIEVLLIAACQGDQVGDWLRVVPYVVTFDSDLPHADAATLTFAFWEQIARGRPVTEALNGALSLCSPEVGEYVVRHW